MIKICGKMFTCSVAISIKRSLCLYTDIRLTSIFMAATPYKTDHNSSRFVCFYCTALRADLCCVKIIFSRIWAKGRRTNKHRMTVDDDLRHTNPVKVFKKFLL